MKAQYGILRFAKYKGPEIGHIEAHNERTKEKYASNPDVDVSRSKYNLHLIKPKRKYRAEAERQIAEAGCRTRSDSVRVVEALITASPEFFKGKKRAEIKEYFSYALDFIKAHQNENTIISAVVHMDEKTPHMHLCFVPITEDGRLSAKDIVGNKKKLTWWQDEFWKHMVKKYPALERGENASKTGREHIPPRLFKEMAHLTKLRSKLDELIVGINPLNKKARLDEIAGLLDKFLPAAEKMGRNLKKYKTAINELEAENDELAKKNKELIDKSKESLLKKLQISQLERDYAAAMDLIKRIPPEVFNEFAVKSNEKPASREKSIRNGGRDI